MPAPKKEVFSKLAKLAFVSKNIKLPTKWKDLGEHYSDAFKAIELKVAPNKPLTLFKESTLNKYHVKSSKEAGSDFEEYIDNICGAICSGIDKWMKMVTISGTIINGPVATVMPGNVIGPHITPLIFAKAPKSSASLTKYSKAIATAVGDQWQTWQNGLMGILNYPTFALLPGPIAPPTPNIPTPLMILSSMGEVGLSPSILKSTMVEKFADSKAQHSNNLFDSIAVAFSNIFNIFKSSTLLMNIMGTGPSANPVLPAPVIGGIILPIPGILQ